MPFQCRGLFRESVVDVPQALHDSTMLLAQVEFKSFEVTLIIVQLRPDADQCDMLGRLETLALARLATDVLNTT